MNNPKISVIIPIYNTGKYLYKCLDSIVNQTYTNLQIILVNDGSTDGSGDVCDEYAQKDSRVTVVHKENGGVSKARNTGMDIADGDYYYFPDSDDFIELDTFDYLLKLIEQYNCDAVCFEYFITYPDKEIEKTFPENLHGLFDRYGAHKVVLEGIPFACNRLYSKKIVGNIRFKENIFRGEDTLFVHSVFENADSVYFDSRSLYHYVQSEESACRGKFRPVQLSGLKLFDEYKNLFEKKYPDLWKIFLKSYLHIPISLYYDMYSDSCDYSKEMKDLVTIYKKQYKMVLQNISLPNKTKLKFDLFKISPLIFCKIHKLIHKL